MEYEGTIIRPPSEAGSILLQVTFGCSYNKCTFCGAYKGTRFRIKERRRVESDLDFAARYCRRQTRVFFTDGDALILPQERLRDLLVEIRRRLPWVKGVSTYANARGLRRKTPAELKELRELGLHRIYMGLESGHDPTLKAIRKGVDAQRMIAAARAVRDAGLFLSVTVLIGIAGEHDSLTHAAETGRVLTSMAPNQVAALMLIIVPDTPLYAAAASGDFRLPTREGLLIELRTVVENIHLERVQFHANHASNYLPLRGRLARDRDAIIGLIDRAIAGRMDLVPESMRRL
jgi:radical SAM superfamily enzyme YgiQ (UPF0313 family)